MGGTVFPTQVGTRAKRRDQPKKLHAQTGSEKKEQGKKLAP
jgi:hypothetical protein